MNLRQRILFTFLPLVLGGVGAVGLLAMRNASELAVEVGRVAAAMEQLRVSVDSGTAHVPESLARGMRQATAFAEKNAKYVADGLARFQGSLVLLLAALLVGLVLLSAWLARRLTRPLRELRAVAEGIARGDLSQAPDRTLPGEVGELARSLEEMRLRLREQIDLLDQAVRDRTEELRASEARYRLLFEQSPAGIFRYTPELVVIEANERCAEILHFTRGELLGQSLVGLAGNGFRDALATALQGRTGHYAGVYESCGDGRIVSLHTAPFSDRAAGAGGGIAVLRDITDQRREQQQRMRLESEMMEAQKLESLGVLSGGVAHDFNNLLMSVLGHADLALSEVGPDDPARPSLMAISTAARRGGDLCRQLLAYSGKGSFRLRTIEINDAVREMGQLLSISISKKAVLHLELTEELPPIRADGAQLRQVIVNLVTNASEALEEREGLVTLRTGVAQQGRAELQRMAHDESLGPGSFVFLEVADTGCGMSEEVRRRAFEPFYTTKFIGRGLGLSAVLGIVRGHRGAVDIESRPGRGSTFRVLFPAQPAPAAAASPAPRAGAVSEGPTVLIAEDEDEIRDVAGKMLRKSGFKVIEACNGQEAVDLFRSHAATIGCVILDLAMPVLDGVESYRLIREIQPDVRVIISTGYNEQDVVTRIGDLEPAGFIQKPYRWASLASTLRSILG